MKGDKSSKTKGTKTKTTGSYKSSKVKGETSSNTKGTKTNGSYKSSKINGETSSKTKGTKTTGSYKSSKIKGEKSSKSKKYYPCGKEGNGKYYLAQELMLSDFQSVIEPDSSSGFSQVSTSVIGTLLILSYYICT